MAGQVDEVSDFLCHMRGCGQEDVLLAIPIPPHDTLPFPLPIPPPHHDLVLYMVIDMDLFAVFYMPASRLPALFVEDAIFFSIV